MAQHNSKTPTEERDSWRTPPWLFAWLDERFEFDVDLAADDENALCGMYYTQESDGLSQPWFVPGIAHRGFLNPPYSSIDPWVEKIIVEKARGFLTVMICPSPNGEDRFAQVFRHATEIIDIVGRVHFLRPDGTECKQNTRGTSVYIFDPARMGAACQRWWVRRDELIRRYGQRAA